MLREIDYTDRNSWILYPMKDSPFHMGRPGEYLKQLRRLKDTKMCDIIFIMRDGREYLHSAVAAAHSNKVSKMVGTTASPPVVVQIPYFSTLIITDIIDWMYNGEAELLLDELPLHLFAAHYLGTVFLHRQLEITLKNQAEKGNVIEALNTACNTDCGVSHDTVHYVVLKVHEKQGSLTSADYDKLSVPSVTALVSTNVPQCTKMHLLNIAFTWCRYQSPPHPMDEIVNAITVNEMNPTDLKAFQRTLTSALRNPSTRKVLNVAMKNGCIVINMDATSSNTSFSDLGGCSPCSLDEDRSISLRKATSASQNVINKNVISPNTCLEAAALPRDSQVFGNPRYNTVGTGTLRAAGATDSVIQHIQELPSDKDVFSNTPVVVKKDSHICIKPKRTESEYAELAKIPDFNEFIQQQESLLQAAKRLGRTKSEVFDINALPDINSYSTSHNQGSTATFGRTGPTKPSVKGNAFSKVTRPDGEFDLLGRQQESKVPLPLPSHNSPFLQVYRTESELIDISKIPDTFGSGNRGDSNRPSRPSDRNARSPRLAGESPESSNPALRNLVITPSLLEQANNQRETAASTRNSDPSPYRLFNRPTYTRSEIQDIDHLPDFFDQSSSHRNQPTGNNTLLAPPPQTRPTTVINPPRICQAFRATTTGRRNGPSRVVPYEDPETPGRRYDDHTASTQRSRSSTTGRQAFANMKNMDLNARPVSEIETRSFPTSSQIENPSPRVSSPGPRSNGSEVNIRMPRAAHSPSEVAAMRAIPDQFVDPSEPPVNRRRTFTRSELEDMRKLPVHFESNSPQREPGYTTSEIREINSLKNVFKKKQTTTTSTPSKSSSSKVKKSKSRPTPSDNKKDHHTSHKNNNNKHNNKKDRDDDAPSSQYATNFSTGGRPNSVYYMY